MGSCATNHQKENGYKQHAEDNGPFINHIDNTNNNEQDTVATLSPGTNNNEQDTVATLSSGVSQHRKLRPQATPHVSKFNPIPKDAPHANTNANTNHLTTVHDD
eukprot:28297_1